MTTRNKTVGKKFIKSKSIKKFMTPYASVKRQESVSVSQKTHHYDLKAL
jgi:hypothetical protein